MSKTAAGLVSHAKAQLGQYYWYGTFGQRPTLDLLNQKRKQYPSQMTAERYDYAKKYHVGKTSKRAFDCAGLVKSYWMMDGPDSDPKYNAAYDKSANGLRSLCKASTNMSSMPDTPGLLVFMSGHVGVYIGNGQVVEARGFDYGVVQTALKARPWTHWGRCPWVEYTDTTKKTTASAAAKTTDSGIAVGDRVRIKCVGVPYYPGFKTDIPKRLDGLTYTVKQLDLLGKHGGVDCVLLKEINSWCATHNVTKA